MFKFYSSVLFDKKKKITQVILEQKKEELVEEHKKWSR